MWAGFPQNTGSLATLNTLARAMEFALRPTLWAVTTFPAGGEASKRRRLATLALASSKAAWYQRQQMDIGAGLGHGRDS